MTAGSDISSRRVTLHLGVQKTASTAFHHFLGKNAGLLAQHLVVRAPKPGTPAQRMGRAAVTFSLDPTRENEARLAELIRATRDEIGSGDVPVLISHENLPGAMPGNGGETALYPMLERILELLEEHLAPWRPTYAFYTREMEAWKRSVHNQAVKSDGYRHGLATFLAQTEHCGSWNELRARVGAIIGAERTAFFALEDETDRSRPGRQLLRLAGVAPEVIEQMQPVTSRINESLNPGALEFMRQVNRAGLAAAARLKIQQVVSGNQGLFSAAPEMTEVRG